MTTKEVAKQAKMSQQAISRWARIGLVKTDRRGNRTIFGPEAAQECIVIARMVRAGLWGEFADWPDSRMPDEGPPAIIKRALTVLRRDRDICMLCVLGTTVHAIAWGSESGWQFENDVQMFSIVVLIAVPGI
mgnify:CR=1 FL=1